MRGSLGDRSVTGCGCGGDQQRHGRGAGDAAGGAEAVRRGRDAPTPTGCTQSQPERPQGQEMPQWWTETPTANGDALTPSTGAQVRHTLPEVVRGCPLTLTRSQPRQTRHMARQAAHGAEHSPIAHHAPQSRHRCHTERRAWRGAQLPTNRAKTSHSRPGMTRRGCAAYLYEYG